VPAPQGATFLDKIIENENSLWYRFKSLQIEQGEQAQFLLIFDQFEEIFSYPKEEIFAFKKQMADLLYSVVPKTFRQILQIKQKKQPDLLSEAQLQQLNQPQHIKLLMAIRDDRYSLMNQLTDYLPDAMHNRYALQALGKEQAMQAITEPAQQTGNFNSLPFTYTAAALSQIIKYLTKDDTQTVETTQLQILCNRIEKLKLTQITPADIPDFEDIFLDYYYDSLLVVPQTLQRDARRFVENELVRKEQRIALDKLVCLDYLPENVLNDLVNKTHLLRAERNSIGGTSFELSHDTLVKPIMQAKQLRVAQEEKAEEERRQAEALREAQEKAEKERIEKDKQARQLRRTRALLAFALVALLVAAVGMVYAFYQQNVAKKASTVAAEKTVIAEQNFREALRQRFTADSAKLQVINALKILDEQRIIAEANAKTAQEAKLISDAYATQARKILNGLIENPNVMQTLVDTESKSDDQCDMFMKSGLVKLKSFKRGGITLTLYQDALLNFKIAEFSGKNDKERANGRMWVDKTSRCISLRQSADSLVYLKKFKEAATKYSEVLKLNEHDLYCRSQIAFCLTDNTKIDWATVEGGEFMMGNPDTTIEYTENERPVHKVKLSGFKMAKYETTNAQYCKFINTYSADTLKSDTAEDFVGRMLIYEERDFRICLLKQRLQDSEKYIWVVSPGYENNPIVFVTWFGAYEFCKFYGYRLPTEAQWEYAARGGHYQNLPDFKNLADLKYAGSNDIDSVAWYIGNNENNPQNLPSDTKPVGLLKPNELDIYDMSGNVYEWCWDWYDAYNNNDQIDPTGSGSGSYRVYRGGSWGYYASHCRVAYRNFWDPSSGYYYLGFRAVLVP